MAGGFLGASPQKADSGEAFNPFGTDADATWKAFVDGVDRRVGAAAGTFREALDAQVSDVARQVAGGETEPVLSVGILSRAYEIAVASVVRDYAERTYDAAPVPAGMRSVKVNEPTGSRFAQRVIAFLADEGAARVKAINDTTKLFIRALLSEAKESGWNPKTAAREMRRRWGDVSRERAERIARTEMIGAANRGSQIGAEEVSRDTGLQMRKVWIATRDTRTRDTHAAADGDAVGLNEPFIVGGYELMHPGDQSAPASEVVNCRCTQAYEVV